MADGDETYYAGAWRCHDCTRSPIDGLETRCPYCGSPRNAILTPEERSWLPPAPRLLTDPDEIAKVSAGPSWNCGHCDEFNWANVEACANCGRPKSSDDTVDRTVSYDDDSPHDERSNVLDERIEGKMDWAERIVQGDDAPRTLQAVTRPASELPRSQGDIDKRIREDTVEYPGLEEQSVPDTPPIAQKLRQYRRPLLIGGAVALLVLILGISIPIIKHFTATVSGSVTVTNFEWERSVEVEQYTTLNLEGWDTPSDARITWTESRHYDDEDIWDTRSVLVDVPKTRDVPSTYDCSTMRDTGNGNYAKVEKSCPTTKKESYTVKERQQKRVIVGQRPIYRDWYHYQVDRWQHARWERTSGTGNTSVSWPEPQIHTGNWVGSQRLGARQERYTLVYTDEQGSTHRSDTSYDVWFALRADDVVPAKYNQRTGRLSSVDWNAAPARVG